ncbi:MAG: carboxymuconolactone decarboxylase family protein [Planctomycetota bacterium]
MSSFTIHTVETAPENARPALERAAKAYGAVPNLIGILAEAPVAVEAYQALGNLVKLSSFTPTERTVVWQTLNAYHNCEYCMAAHTTIAHTEKIDQAVIETARNVGSYDDPRLEALRVFTLTLADKRGWAEDHEVDAFLAAGFTRQNILEVITTIAQKVMSNYTNHLAKTPVDDGFAKHEWKHPNPRQEAAEAVAG